MGLTLLEALHNKYKEDDTECDITIFVPKCIPTVNESGDAILHIPQQLTLNRCDISSCGSVEELKKQCEKITELDLALNELSEWEEIKQILVTLDKIHFLNLSNNPLESLSIPEEDDVIFCKLEKLVLNSTSIKQAQVKRLLKACPNLQELHLSLNEYREVTLDCCHQGVTSLYFNGNKISQWLDLAKLGTCFPSLVNLVLMDTDIAEFGQESDARQAFPKLKTLNISRGYITKWEEMEKLNNFPSLEELRASDIPVIQDLHQDIRRPMTIAYLPGIRQLNRSKVHEKEKDDSERLFIRHFMEKEEKPSRYHELEAKHGKLDPLVELDWGVKDTVNVTVKYEGNSVLKTFSLFDTTTKVKKQLESFTKLKASQMRLFHVCFVGESGDMIMSYPTRTLARYGVNDGDEIDVVVDNTYVKKKLNRKK